MSAHRILVRRELARQISAERELSAAERAELELGRPKRRSQCVDGPRPCPWVSCRYHLALDVSPRSGAIQYAHPDLELEQLEDSCALDVADRGGVTLEAIAQLLNVTRERVRQLETAGLVKLRRAAARGELEPPMPPPEQSGDFEP